MNCALKSGVRKAPDTPEGEYWELYGNITNRDGRYESVPLTQDSADPTKWSVKFYLNELYIGNFIFRKKDPRVPGGWRCVGSPNDPENVTANVVALNGTYTAGEYNIKQWQNAKVVRTSGTETVPPVILTLQVNGDGTYQLIVDQQFVAGNKDVSTTVKARIIFDNGDVYEDCDGFLSIPNRKLHNDTCRATPHNHNIIIQNESETGFVESLYVQTMNSKEYYLVKEGYNNIGLADMSPNRKLSLMLDSEGYDLDVCYNYTFDWRRNSQGWYGQDCDLIITKVGTPVKVVDANYDKYHLQGSVRGDGNSTDIAVMDKVDADSEWYVARNIYLDGKNIDIVRTDASGNLYGGNDSDPSRGRWWGKADNYVIKDGVVHPCINEYENGKGNGHNFELDQPGCYTVYFSPTLNKIRVVRSSPWELSGNIIDENGNSKTVILYQDPTDLTKWSVTLDKVYRGKCTFQKFDPEGNLITLGSNKNSADNKSNVITVDGSYPASTTDMEPWEFPTNFDGWVKLTLEDKGDGTYNLIVETKLCDWELYGNITGIGENKSVKLNQDPTDLTKWSVELKSMISGNFSFRKMSLSGEDGWITVGSPKDSENPARNVIPGDGIYVASATEMEEWNNQITGSAKLTLEVKEDCTYNLIVENAMNDYWELYGNVTTEDGSYASVPLQRDPADPTKWSVKLPSTTHVGNFTFRKLDPAVEGDCTYIGSPNDPANQNSNVITGNGTYPGSTTDLRQWNSKISGEVTLTLQVKEDGTYTLKVEGAKTATRPVMRITFTNYNTYAKEVVYEDNSGILCIPGRMLHNGLDKTSEHSHLLEIEYVTSNGSTQTFRASGGKLYIGNNSLAKATNGQVYNSVYLNATTVAKDSRFNYILDWRDISKPVLTISRVETPNEADYNMYRIQGKVQGSNNSYEDIAVLDKVDDNWYIAKNIRLDGSNISIIRTDAVGVIYGGEDGDSSRGRWWGTAEDYFINDVEEHDCKTAFEIGNGHNFELGGSGCYTVYFSPTLQKIKVINQDWALFGNITDENGNEKSVTLQHDPQNPGNWSVELDKVNKGNFIFRKYDLVKGEYITVGSSTNPDNVSAHTITDGGTYVASATDMEPWNVPFTNTGYAKLTLQDKGDGIYNLIVETKTDWELYGNITNQDGENKSVKLQQNRYEPTEWSVTLNKVYSGNFTFRRSNPFAEDGWLTVGSPINVANENSNVITDGGTYAASATDMEPWNVPFTNTGFAYLTLQVNDDGSYNLIVDTDTDWEIYGNITTADGSDASVKLTQDWRNPTKWSVSPNKLYVGNFTFRRTNPFAEDGWTHVGSLKNTENPDSNVIPGDGTYPASATEMEEWHNQIIGSAKLTLEVKEDGTYNLIVENATNDYLELYGNITKADGSYASVPLQRDPADPTKWSVKLPSTTYPGNFTFRKVDPTVEGGWTYIGSPNDPANENSNVITGNGTYPGSTTDIEQWNSRITGGATLTLQFNEDGTYTLKVDGAKTAAVPVKASITFVESGEVYEDSTGTLRIPSILLHNDGCNKTTAHTHKIYIELEYSDGSTKCLSNGPDQAKIGDNSLTAYGSKYNLSLMFGETTPVMDSRYNYTLNWLLGNPLLTISKVGAIVTVNEADYNMYRIQGNVRGGEYIDEVAVLDKVDDDWYIAKDIHLDAPNISIVRTDVKGNVYSGDNIDPSNGRWWSAKNAPDDYIVDDGKYHDCAIVADSEDTGHGLEIEQGGSYTVYFSPTLGQIRVVRSRPVKVEIYTAGGGLYTSPDTEKIPVENETLTSDQAPRYTYTFEEATVGSDFKFKVTMTDGTEYWYVSEAEANKATDMEPETSYKATGFKVEEPAGETTGYYHIVNGTDSSINTYDITFDWSTQEVYLTPVVLPNFKIAHIEEQFGENEHYVVRGLPDEGSWKLSVDDEIVEVALPSTTLAVSHKADFGGITVANEDHYANVEVTVAPQAGYAEFFAAPDTKNKHAVIVDNRLASTSSRTYSGGEHEADRSIAEVKAFTAGHYTVTVASGDIYEDETRLFKHQSRDFKMIVTPTVESIGLALNGNLIMPEFTTGDDYTYQPGITPLHVVVNPDSVYYTGAKDGKQIEWHPAKRTNMHSMMADNDQVEVYFKVEAKQGAEPGARTRSVVRRTGESALDNGSYEVPDGYTKYSIYNTLNTENLGLDKDSDKPAKVSFVVKQNGIVGQPQTVNVYTKQPGNVPTDIEEIDIPADGDEGETVIYDLHGIRIDAENLIPGVYVVVKGNKAEKVYLK